MTGTASTIIYDHLETLTIEEQIRVLSELATELRDAAKREHVGQSDLTVVLVDLLRASNAGQDGRDALHEQAGRVVANFVADNDDNRSRTISTDYLSIASAYVASTLKSPASADRPRVAGKESPEDVERQAARKAVIASFLNLVVQGHEPSVEAVGNGVVLSNLLASSTGLYERLVKDQSGEDGDGVEDVLESYDTVLGWIWTILSLAVPAAEKEISLTPDILGGVFLPLLTPNNLVEAASDPETVTERFCTAAECLAAIASRSTSPDIWTTRFEPPIDTQFAHPYRLYDTRTPLSALLTLIEYADGGEDAEFAKAKGSLTNALVDLGSILSIIPADPSTPSATQAPSSHGQAFPTLLSWTSSSRIPARDDLRMAAFLTIGNGITSDSTCRALSESHAGQELVRNAVDALGGTAQAQHAAMGFLRNLSVPVQNKARLGSEEVGLWGALMRAGVWDEGKDMLGSVQGGAVGLVKNLCRDTLPNVQIFLALPQATDQLIALHKRTDDPAIKFEIARIYVNCIRAVYGSRPTSTDGTAESSSVPLPSDDRPASAKMPPDSVRLITSPAIIHILCDMLAQSAQYPILANEAIIALALLATFGVEEAGNYIGSAIAGKAVDVLVSILAPSADAPSSRETRANAVTLLNTSAVKEARATVSARLKGAAAAEGEVEGQEVSDEGKALCEM